MSRELRNINQSNELSGIFSNIDQIQIDQFRFVFGMTLSISIAYGVEWFLSYILPTCVCVLLSLPLDGFPLKRGITYMIQAVIAFVFAFSFSLLFLNYPFAFILALSVVFFHLYYYLNKGGEFWMGFISIFFMVSLPLLTHSKKAFALGFSYSLITSVCLSVIIIWLSYFIFPSIKNKILKKSLGFQKGYSKTATILALKNTLILLPIVILFIFFDLTTYLIVMIYSVTFTFKPELTSSIAAGFKSIVSTCIAGVITFFLYWLIIAIPEFFFFIVLMFVVSLIFALNIFKETPNAKYFISSFNAIIILLSQGMAVNTNYFDLLFTRISLICLVITYIVLVLKAFEYYFPSKE